MLLNDPASPLEYDRVKRLYSIVSVPQAFRKKNELSIAYEITHCPFCGTRFPKELSDEWYAIVEKEFGITSALDENIQKLPQEFLSDEWWKKRKI